MKKYFIFIAAATALLLTTSCQKDETVQCFTARLEKSSSDAKTILSGTHIYWNHNSDQVEIYDASGTHATFLAQQHSTHREDRTYANLVNTSNTLSTSGGYKAIYPASIAKGSNTIELPRVQTSTDGSLTGYPMYAESSNKSLQFYNLCSVLKLNLEKAGESVSKIQIVTDKLTTGTFTIAYNGGNPTLTPTNGYNNHTAVTTLQLGTAQSINTAKDFYIYLPAFNYSYMQIKVYNAQGLLFFKTWQKTANENPMTLVRSRYHTITFGENDLEFHEGNVNGKFHVSSTKIVTFANGNLLQTGTNQYKFANNQYDYTEGSYTYRFNWADGQYNNTYNERGGGGANISNCTGTGWYTLSKEEWRYVTNFRSNFHSTSFSHNRALVQITKSDSTTVVGGLLLFPDFFYWPLDASKQPTDFEGGTSATDWNGIIYTYNDWKVLEDAGCVFLPTTNGYSASLSTEQDQGWYWSKTPYYSSNNDRSYCTYFTPKQCLFSGGQYKFISSEMSIRLVRQVN